MNSCLVYENEDMRKVTGDTLRPGGFFLTDRAIELCNFKANDKLLDIGCGMGVTVDRLKNVFKMNAFGIDPSQKLLGLGREKYPNNQIKSGMGEEIPYKDSEFNGIFAECTMSLMQNIEKTIMESNRVLQDKGYFIINDVYARSPEHLGEVQNYNISSCMRGLLDIDILKKLIESSGYKITYFEDFTVLLKQLMVKIIFKYGSMSIFWKAATLGCGNCDDFQEKLKLCKPGYFLMVAQKI